MTELTKLEAGKTYVFKDEQSKEAYLKLEGTFNKLRYEKYYNGGYKIDYVCDYGYGIVGFSFAITKSEFHFFKLKQENNTMNKSNEFTKDMLEAGKHIVELNDGVRYLAVEIDNKLTFVNSYSHFKNLNNYSNDLKDSDFKKFNVKKIYIIKNLRNIKNILSDTKNLMLIWERQELTEQQKKIIELENTIKQAQQQIEELKQSN